MKMEATLSQELVDLALAVMRIVKQEFKAQAGLSSLTLTQFKILHKIKNGVRHVGKLSEVFEISQPATSIMVNTMVQQGLLKRVPHPTDRRQIELHLTTKGSAKLETSYKQAFAKIDGKLMGLSKAKKDAGLKQVRELSRLLLP
jgi:DNA-binding MarR family transcriptional regulator